MGIRSPEGGDKPSNSGLSDFKFLLEQRGVGPRAQNPERQFLPGERQWRPVLPEDIPKVEAFFNDLTQHKEELRHHMQYYCKNQISLYKIYSGNTILTSV
jgi:hypothetical protein